MNCKDRIVVREKWILGISIICLLIAIASFWGAFNTSNEMELHNKVCEENHGLDICVKQTSVFSWTSSFVYKNESLLYLSTYFWGVIGIIFFFATLASLYEFILGEEYYILKKNNSDKCYLKKVNKE